MHRRNQLLERSKTVLIAAMVRPPGCAGLSSTTNSMAAALGVTMWVVTLGRLIWRQFSRFPNWPADMPQTMRFAAQWSEYALYALLLTQPILGLLQTNAHGERVNLFFLGQLPALIGQDRLFAKQLLEVHETVGLLLLGLIALHASAALYHHFWRRDDTLEAMLPQGMRRRAARDRVHES